MSEENQKQGKSLETDVILLDDIDWAKASIYTIVVNAQEGVPQAIKELARRNREIEKQK